MAEIRRQYILVAVFGDNFLTDRTYLRNPDTRGWVWEQEYAHRFSSKEEAFAHKTHDHQEVWVVDCLEEESDVQET